MKLRVLLFGIVREIAGSSTAEIELDNPSVGDLISKLQEQHSDLKNLKSLLVSVNNEYAESGTILSSEDEIAVIPPVAGG